MRYRWIGFMMFAVLLAFGTPKEQTAGFAITIDATPLTPQATQLQAIAVFPQATPTTFRIVPTGRSR